MANIVSSPTGHPEIKSNTASSIEGQLFTARCCVYIALWPNRVPIEWFIDGCFSIPSSSVSTHIFKSNRQATLCSTFTFKSNRRYHLTLVTCLVRNELNLSSSLQLEVLCKLHLSILVNIELSMRFYVFILCVKSIRISHIGTRIFVGRHLCANIEN